MTPLHPWVTGPFELLVHAEEHLRLGEDVDRRIALIGFDNAIEIAIGSYLLLKPIQRGNRSYQTSDVAHWLSNYHTKLDFLESELVTRKDEWLVDRAHIIWCHDHRNEQYHGGYKGVPEKQVLDIVRRAAIWIFGYLFGVTDVEERLAQALAAKVPKQPPQRNPIFDSAIDGLLDTIKIEGQIYSASEVLYWVDYEAYRDMGIMLSQNSESGGALH